MELALKARICRTLKWDGYPEQGEFNKLQSFRTHDLDMLLRLSGQESKVKSACLTDWSTVAKWDPQLRCQAPGTAARQAARELIDAAKAV